MITRAFSVCFVGIEPQLVEIECAISPGLSAFSIIGLPDKAVSEARDRIRSALGRCQSRCPRVGSQSTCPLPICPRKGRIWI